MGESKDGNVTCFMYTQMRIVGLASYDFWDLLKDEFSTALEEEKAQAKAKPKARAA